MYNNPFISEILDTPLEKKKKSHKLLLCNTRADNYFFTVESLHSDISLIVQIYQSLMYFNKSRVTLYIDIIRSHKLLLF